MERPQFTITELDIPDVSADLAEQIRVAAFVKLPANSLEVDVNAVRTRVEGLAAVERARVRALRARRSGDPRHRAHPGGRLALGEGLAASRPGRRARRRDRQPPAPHRSAADRGRGRVEQHVPEALALLAAARPVAGRVRGLVRIGERRWDLVLDRDQVIRLPDGRSGRGAGRGHGAARGGGAADARPDVVDMRDPARPMLRLTEHSLAELARLRAMVGGEDA